jgi:hypothetical protein
MKSFGIACQNPCGRFVPLGQVDIEGGVSPSQLRAKLAAQGFKGDWGDWGDWGDCEHCDTKTWCSPEQPILEYQN